MKLSIVMPVLAPTSFLRAMTEFAIKTLRLHADHEFELVMVEAVDDYFDPKGSNINRNYSFAPDGQHDWDYDPLLRIDKYLRFNPKIGGVREANVGFDAASGEFIVSTGNDVFAPPHWDTELLRAFELYPDCGVSALSAFEPGWIIGPREPQDLIVEGMYSPFMMWRKGWRWDEAYERVYQDSDLIMRMYAEGKRAYRSCRAHVHHLGGMTNDRVDTAAHNRQLALDEGLFYQRWGRSPLTIFGVIRSGQWTYGREYEALTRPINLHK